MEKETEVRYQIIANTLNNEYDVLFEEIIENGFEILYDMLKETEAVRNRDITKYLKLSIRSKNQKLINQIYKDRKLFKYEESKINKFEILNMLIQNDLYESFELIYKNECKYTNSLKEEEIENDEKINELMKKITLKSELSLIKIVKKHTEKIFYTLYYIFIIISIKKGSLDIFDYLSQELEINKLDDKDKYEILELALETKNPDIFTIVYEIIEGVNLLETEGENILERSKECHNEIFEYLYNEISYQKQQLKINQKI